MSWIASATPASIESFYKENILGKCIAVQSYLNALNFVQLERYYLLSKYHIPWNNLDPILLPNHLKEYEQAYA